MSSTPAHGDNTPLAKYLASTDKKTRDKAVKNLAVFLSRAPENVLSTPEMDKLWKGIFYCFWMSDKPLVQQALATELAELLLTITDTIASLAFLKGFWTTIVREWNGIDRLRIDKYYMLVRRFTNATFRLLIKTHWDTATLDAYNGILASEGGPLCPTDTRVPTSLTYHLADIYLEELDKSLATNSEQNFLPAPLSVLLDPFLTLMALTPTNTTYKRVYSSLLEPLLGALTYPQDSDGEPNSKEGRREPGAYSNIVLNACMNNAQIPEPLDRTALKQRLLRMVFEVGSRPETKESNRRKMYAIWRKEAEEMEDSE